MQTNTLAYAKVVVNKRLNMLRVLVTFDSTKRDKDNCIIVSTSNAAYVSGDLCSASANADVTSACIARALANASVQLYTNNIVLL